MTIVVDWLHKRAQLSPNQLTLIDTIEGRRITFREWNTQANQARRPAPTRSGCPPRRAAQARPRRLPLFHIWVKLVDNAGNEVIEPDIAGGLLIRGPHRTPGYWDNPEATAAAIDGDGWLHTGDLAQRDAEGYYAIVGRAKDMIISPILSSSDDLLHRALAHQQPDPRAPIS